MRAWGAPVVAVMMAVAAAPATADAALEQLRRDALATPMMGFERTATTRQGDEPETVRVDRFDPRARPGEQWTLVSLDGAPPSEKESQRHAEQMEKTPVPGFYRLNSLLAGDPTEITRNGVRTTYRWAALEKGAAPTGRGPDFSDKLSGEAIVRTDGPRPVLEQVRIFAAEPFGIMGVAKMKQFEAVTRYTLMAQGHVLASQETQVDARVPFRRSGATRTVATFKPL